MPIATNARTQPKKRFFRRKVNPAKTVKEWELTKLRKQMKRLIPKPELKYKDTTASGTTITTTGTIVRLDNISDDASDTGRIGDKITARSIQMRLAITPNATAGSNFLRVILFLDKQPNGSTATTSLLLEAPTNYNSPLYLAYGKRFKVLFDRTYTVDTDATGSQVDKLFRKLRYVAEFNDSGNVSTNQLNVLFLSDQATNGPSISYYFRLRWIDP